MDVILTVVVGQEVRLTSCEWVPPVPLQKLVGLQVLHSLSARHSTAFFTAVVIIDTTPSYSNNWG